MKKILIILLVVATLAGAVWGFIYLRQQSQTQRTDILRTGQVQRGTLEITVAASGNVAANQKAELRFASAGTVAEVLVDVGDYVAAGDVLARLNTDDLQRAVRQSELALEQAQLNLEQLTKTASEEDIALARLTLNQAAQSLEVARISKEVAQSQGNEMMRQATTARDRASQNYHATRVRADQGEIPGGAADQAYLAYLEMEGQLGVTLLNAELQIQQSQDQWLRAYNAYRQAQENMRRLEDGASDEQIQQANLQIEQTQLSLEQTQARLADALLKAPFAGVVAAVNLQTGQAPAGLPAIVLVDDAQFFVDITVDETDVGKLALDQAVAVTLDAYPNTALQGQVERIAPAANSMGGVVTYPVRVRLSPDDRVQVRDGMTANVSINTSRKENVLLAPNWAIRTERTGGETFIYAYHLVDGELRRVAVTVGMRNEAFTEVLSGLEEGMTVALVTEERVLFDFENAPSGPPNRR